MTAKNEQAHAPAAAHEHHVPNVRTYLIVFGCLIFLTCLTVWVSHLELAKPQAIAVGLVIATVKASLVAAFFMHLIGERTLIWGIISLTAVFCVGLYTLPITDFAQNSDRITHTPVLEEPVVEPQPSPTNQPGGEMTPENAGEAQPSEGKVVPAAKPRAENRDLNAPPKRRQPAKKAGAKR